MRRLVIALAIVAVAGASTVGLAQDKKAEKAKAKTVQGVLVDMKCYSMMPAENAGNDHMTPKGKMPACATACAKMGIPVGIAAADGEDLFVLITPAGSLADHMAAEAKITGDVALNGHGLIPSKIEVKKDGKWQEVKIATMM